MLVYELPYELTPRGYHHPNGDQDDSYYKEYEREHENCSEIDDSRVDVVFYWYSGGSYCGAGQFLMKLKDGKWILHDGGHCSCNGPLDDINYDATFDSLNEMTSRCSQSYLSDVEPLINMAKEKGYR